MEDEVQEEAKETEPKDYYCAMDVKDNYKRAGNDKLRYENNVYEILGKCENCKSHLIIRIKQGVAFGSISDIMICPICNCMGFIENQDPPYYQIRGL